MKTALLLSGQLRGFEHCIENMKQYFLPVFQDVDFYFYGLKDSTTIEQFLPIDKCKSVYLEEDVKDIFENMNFDTMGSYPLCPASVQNGYTNHANPTHHFSLQWYYVKKCFELAASNKSYDTYVRVRPDIYFTGPLNIEYDNTKLYLSNRFEYGGVCDRIAFGNFDNMKLYSSFFDECHKFNGNSETRLKQYLNTHGMNISFFDTIYCHKNKDNSNRYTDYL